MISWAGGFMLWLSPHLQSFVAPGFGSVLLVPPLPKHPLRLLPWRCVCWGAEGSRVASSWAGKSWWRCQICRAGLEVVWSFAQSAGGPAELTELQGWLGLGLRWGGGFVFLGSRRKGEKSLSLPSDLSLAGSVAWEGGSRIEGCYMGCQGTRMAQWLAW